MKIVIKLGILYTNEKFTVAEKHHLKTLLKKFSRSAFGKSQKFSNS